MGKVIYLTGVPASGKSSLCSLMEAKAASTQIFRFGFELTNLINERNTVTQEDLRTQSAYIVTPGDVVEIDKRAADFVEANRSSSDVIIDTHALTREPYGFRMTPISQSLIRKIAPDFFVTLCASPVSILERISKSSKGRPTLSTRQLELQATLQNTIPTAYSIICGKPAYFFENENESDLELIANEMTKLISAPD